MKACDTLRGKINTNDYKEYILKMLFLKKINDAFNKEKE
ncbi:type I restriction-modification system subunit M N-terminal domain-containing protein [bacterium]|nr:type I restriction-modification system subunit M N-terminal domain-containing protein [bacterium]